MNKCGARGTLDELDAEQINPVHLVKKNDSSLTESQIQTLQALISIELSTKKEDAGKYNFDIRGMMLFIILMDFKIFCRKNMVKIFKKNFYLNIMQTEIFYFQF